MSYYDDTNRNNIIKIVGACIAVIVLAICTVLIINNVVNHGGGARIEYSGEDKKATITIGNGSTEEESGLGEAGEEVEINGIPTVESVDADTPVVNTEAGDGISMADCPEGEECGLGAYIYAPTESASQFKEYTIGKCLNTDNAYGAQCWDLADVFWQNYAGRRAQTCGTGAAKGMTNDGCWQKNAGNDFEMIWNAKELQAGDWVIFGNGQYGHVGMALGSYNDGYVTLLGQNQGGGYCDGGGSSTNIINISLKHFSGAFRPKDYIVKKVEPEPEPEESSYTVQKGDTLGAIIRKMGWYNEKNGLYGDAGYAEKIAKFNGITNRGLIYPGQVIRPL